MAAPLPMPPKRAVPGELVPRRVILRRKKKPVIHQLPSQEYDKIAQANRLYYAETAWLYEKTESCVAGRHAQAMLERDLDRILSMHRKMPRELRVLDACGGSGNVSVKLLARGLDVTICDISPDLLDIFRTKAAAQQFSARVVCGDIREFLAVESGTYDLIIFSSALHHLREIEAVLGLACSRLEQHGLLFTVFDPLARDEMSWLGRLLLLGDYLSFKILKQTGDLPSAAWRSIARKVDSIGPGLRGAAKDKDAELLPAYLGVLAEYHARRGIDDGALVRHLRAIGMEVIWHDRYPDARFALTRHILSRANQPTAFKLLLRRPPSVEGTSTESNTRLPRRAS